MSLSKQLEPTQSVVTQTKGRQQSTSIVLLIGIIFIAVNLRAPLTSVGPLVEVIRRSFTHFKHFSGDDYDNPLTWLCRFFTICSDISTTIWNGTNYVYFYYYFNDWNTLRSTSGMPGLYIGTTIVGLTIAVCNVLLPSMIKRDYPERVGLMTGIYSVSMNLMGAVASGISIPIAVGLGLGWQGGLGVWGILSFLAILFWLPHLKKGSCPTLKIHRRSTENKVNLWRSPLAWQVTLFMGLQSLVFYVLITWLPEILKQQGASLDQSGWYLSILLLAVLPVTFIAPILAGRMANQRPLVAIMCSSLFIGILGLLFGSMNLIIVWVILLGIGSGLSFSLAMMFFSLRTENASQAAALSGMAQSVGYLLAATGPTIFGYLYDITGQTIPLLLLLGVTGLLFIVGLGAGRNQVIGSVGK